MWERLSVKNKQTGGQAKYIYLDFIFFYWDSLYQLVILRGELRPHPELLEGGGRAGPIPQRKYEIKHQGGMKDTTKIE